MHFRLASARRRRYLLAAAGATAVTLVAQLGIGQAADAAPTATGGSESVIVVLRDQLANTPATEARSNDRRNVATGAQNAVLNRLTGQKPSNVKHFSLGNVFSATVTGAQAAALAADPAVATVTPDKKVDLSQLSPTTPAGASATRSAPASQGAKAAAAQPICPADPKKPLLEPEALTSINAAGTAASADKLASGKGVTVGFLADNMDPNYADFIRPNGQHVFSDYKDFSGDGPNTTESGAEAFGDASSIAAQGVVVHDLSDFVNEKHPLPKGCNIVVKGVSPDANLVGLNVFGSNSNDTAIIQAIDYAVTVDHVDVLNESLGLNQYPDLSSRNLFQVFNDNAVKAGVTVTASSGDAGITNTIGSPAAGDPNILSVGATTDNRLYAQTTYAAFPFSNGHWTSDDISALSSSGFTQNGRTIDLVAPGEGNWSDCSPKYAECKNFKSTPTGADLESFGGTSESAPLTAGVAALVIQAYRDHHKGNSPTPAQVKQFITSTAKDIGVPADEQGAGLLDARAATEAAITAPTANVPAPAGVKSNIAVSTDQLDLQGAPGSTQRGSLKVTNVGTKPLTVNAGTRDFAPQGSQTQSGTFDASNAQPFTYYDGTTWRAKKITFNVASGAQRLLARLAWTGGTKHVVRMTLLAPDGTFVANSRPQGGAVTPNYANVDVRSPKAGTWTAVLYSATTGDLSYTGPYKFAADTQVTRPYGQVSQGMLSLAPGQTKTLNVTMPIPGSGGDSSKAVTLGSSDGHQTSVAVILRSLVQGSFSGTITGGNARASSPGETFSYAFDVPKGKRDLDVGVTLAKDPGDLVDGVLVDPNGETADINSNISLKADGTGVQGKGLQLTRANPIPGRWQLVLVVQNPVTGNDLSQDFNGTIGFNQVLTNVGALPTGKVQAGQAVRTTVQVANTSPEPMAVGVDPRTNGTQTLQPTPLAGSSEVDVPSNNTPIYLVPPDTKSLSVAANTTVPAQILLTSAGQGIELFGDLAAAHQGSTVTATSVSERTGDVGTGLWFTGIGQVGPFGPDGAPPGHASITASMKTAGFDRTVTSTTGDPFLAAVDPNASLGNPVIIQPGRTATITVTVVPTGKKGSTVDGHLNLVTVPTVTTNNEEVRALPAYGTGELLATVPYRYTIG